MSTNKNATAQIVFTPSGKRGDVPIGISVLEAARMFAVDLDSVCGGRGICGRCQIQPEFGNFPKFKLQAEPENIGTETELETRYRRVKGLGAGRRLGCACKIFGDIVVDVPAESQIHRQIIRKQADRRPIERDPAVKLFYIEMTKPTLDNPKGNWERCLEALQKQWKIDEYIAVSLDLLTELPGCMEAGDYKLTLAIRKGREGRNTLVAVWPGFRDRALGVAIDIGSTTMSVHLTSLDTGEVIESTGAMNPQIRFGEDLMSRVSYAMLNENGARAMTHAVRERIALLIEEACTAASVEMSDIVEIIMVGNPIMHHLMLGFDPQPLGIAPFAPVLDSAQDVPFPTLGFSKLAPGGVAHFLPLIAGHVGADAAAVLLSEAPWQKESLTLIVDIGTNAEIMLGNNTRILACSSPTGPALEGAQISSGQRAAPGAIERVRIDRKTLTPKIQVIGSDYWSDDPEFENSVENTGVTGICGSGIVEAIAELFLSGVLAKDGIIRGELAKHNDRIVPSGRVYDYVLWRGKMEIRITQSDIRAIQLAKAALYAGAKLLMRRLGIESPDSIVLAGAFGSHIDPKYAMVLGLIPDCPLANVRSAGNAAGTGARIALVNREARLEIARRARRVEKIETAIDPEFQNHFVDAMSIPHSRDGFAHLSAEVEMPASFLQRETQEEENSSSRGMRRRRKKRIRKEPLQEEAANV